MITKTIPKSEREQLKRDRMEEERRKKELNAMKIAIKKLEHLVTRMAKRQINDAERIRMLQGTVEAMKRKK